MDLMQYLPGFYHGTIEVQNLQAAIGAEADIVKAAVADTLDQLYVDSATWGLANWERYLGLPIDPAETLDNRRSRIMTRLRGQGTTTAEMIKNVCASFSGGEVQIIENYADYSFKIKFVGTLGRPDNLNYLAATIESVKPAHLAYSFEFIFNTHLDLSRFTHQQLSAWTHQQLREQKLS